MEVDDNDQEKEYEKKKKGPLHSLFFGKLKREVFHQNKEGILELSTEQTEDFLSIFLNPVSSNELYGAWDEEFVHSQRMSKRTEQKRFQNSVHG